MVDTFDNTIIASHISNRRGDPGAYYNSLSDLKKLTIEKTTPTVLHTDQGAVYSSHAYNIDLDKYNIKRSMSRTGTPTDNPGIESLNSWLKGEISTDFDIDDYNDLSEFLECFTMYFNAAELEIKF